MHWEVLHQKAVRQLGVCQTEEHHLGECQLAWEEESCYLQLRLSRRAREEQRGYR